ncbi:hypothetical protein NQ314_019585 [Rhamnusium bicolor]|uniref:Uncharacterized protein n=1 Tax=Rhamnusium bicolor TaxID=1586634 RepID=A0AAV8WNU3_9CUCU|nr:hypothetical protein NQ314_019585 [Rhamnusium bicolor]
MVSITTTRPKIDTRYRFVSRKPILRTTTSKRKEDTTEAINDQVSESSNQQSLEEDFEGGKTTELGDLAVALQSIQQAPIPNSNYVGTTLRVPLTTRLGINNGTLNVPQTTQRTIHRVIISSTPHTTQRKITRSKYNRFH